MQTRTHGQAGLHAAVQLPAPTDPGQAVMLGLLPWLSIMAGQQYAALATAGGSLPFSLGNPPQTLSCPTHCTPPTSPLPAQADELHQFLVALSVKKNVDLLHCEKELVEQEFTPDILPDVAFCQLKGHS